MFSPLENSASRDFDPLFTYTSPSLSRRPSCTSTTMLAESPTQRSPTSLHVFTEPPPFDTPPQVSASAYHPLVDLLAVSPSAGEFSAESSPTFLSSYHSPTPLAESSSSSSLHVLTESPLPDTPIPHLSPYQPGSMVDLLAMSPSAEFFRPQSPPVFPTPYYESPPYTEMPIPTLPSEAPFQSLPMGHLVPVEQHSTINIPTGNIPSTVYETLEKDTCCDVYKPVNRLDEAQVLTSDDELCSSQESELLTMYS